MTFKGKWLKEEGVKLDTKNVASLHMEELQFSSGETFDDVKHIAINASGTSFIGPGRLFGLYSEANVTA